MLPMAIEGDAGFTASTSAGLLPGPDNTAQVPGDHRPSDTHRDDAGAPAPAVTGRGRCPVKRMRGRPSGSKNKPKPPVVITQENPAALRFQVVDVPSGASVEAVVASFARSRRVGIVILTGTGAVYNVTLREPRKTEATPPTVCPLRGRYEILALHGYFLPEPWLPGAGSVAGLAVYLASTQGHVLGGFVVGQLRAMGPVRVIAAMFSPTIEDREATARSMLGGLPQGVQLLQSSGDGAGGGGGSWASLSDPMVARTAAMPMNMQHNLVFNDQIPELLAESWASSAMSSGAPPSS